MEDFTDKELENIYKMDLFITKLNDMSEEEYNEHMKKVNERFDSIDFDLDIVRYLL